MTNLRPVFGMAAFVCFAVLIGAFAYAYVEKGFELKPTLVPFKTLGGIVLLFGVLASVPSINDLWRVRIGLIKYNLASPENVKQTIETIERIGKKLECKYLGCEETK